MPYFNDDYLIRRDEDFFNVYLSVISKNPDITIEDAIRIAIHSPAKEYYISIPKALIYCNKICKRKKLPISPHSEKRIAINNIYNAAVKKSRNENIPLREAVAYTVVNAAPRFYITRSMAREIIHKMILRK